MRELVRRSFEHSKYPREKTIKEKIKMNKTLETAQRLLFLRRSAINDVIRFRKEMKEMAKKFDLHFDLVDDVVYKRNLVCKTCGAKCGRIADSIVCLSCGRRQEKSL